MKKVSDEHLVNVMEDVFLEAINEAIKEATFHDRSYDDAMPMVKQAMMQVLYNTFIFSSDFTEEEVSNIFDRWIESANPCELIGHKWERPYEDDGRDMNARCARCGAPET